MEGFRNLLSTLSLLRLGWAPCGKEDPLEIAAAALRLSPTTAAIRSDLADFSVCLEASRVLVLQNQRMLINIKIGKIFSLERGTLLLGLLGCRYKVAGAQDIPFITQSWQIQFIQPTWLNLVWTDNIAKS